MIGLALGTVVFIIFLDIVHDPSIIQQFCDAPCLFFVF